MNVLLQHDSNKLVASYQGRRRLGEYQALSQERIANGKQVGSLADAGLPTRPSPC